MSPILLDNHQPIGDSCNLFINCETFKDEVHQLQLFADYCTQLLNDLGKKSKTSWIVPRPGLFLVLIVLNSSILEDKYMFKFSNRDTGEKCEICSKLISYFAGVVLILLESFFNKQSFFETSSNQMVFHEVSICNDSYKSRTQTSIKHIEKVFQK